MFHGANEQPSASHRLLDDATRRRAEPPRSDRARIDPSSPCCEQPIARWNLDGFRRLRERVSIPIMADESVFDHHDAFKLTAGGCCDYLNIKLAKSAGIHTALKINAVAEACGVACMVGCMMETRLGLTAAAHLVSARPNIRYADLDGHLQLKEDPIVGGASWDGGTITLPDEPGIGAEVDPTFLERCERSVVA